MKLDNFRYIVLRKADIEKYLTREEMYNFAIITRTIAQKRSDDGKEPYPQYVCIRNTWPEYEAAVASIEGRIDESTVYS